MKEKILNRLSENVFILCKIFEIKKFFFKNRYYKRKFLNLKKKIKLNLYSIKISNSREEIQV